MRNYILILSAFLIGCSPKIPQVIYQDRVITSYDTISLVSKQTDTIPCDDFNYKLIENTDTVYVSVVKNQIKVRTIIRKDTIYRTPVIIQPQPKRIKIDNSVTAKKNSIIGDGNTVTTKKTNWWWVFLSGMLTMFVIQNVIWKTIKTYIKII